MKRQRIVAKVTDGHLPAMVRKQIAGLLSRVKNGREIVIELFDLPTRRSVAQNDGFWAMITPWAKEEGHDPDDLKRDLLGIVFGWSESPLSESRVPLKPHSSMLTKDEFSELMNRTVEIAARTGVILTLPNEYNDSKWMPGSMQGRA